MMTFIYEIVHRESVQEPGPDSPSFHVIRILNIISVAVLLVADDVYVKHILYGPPVVVECLQRQVDAVAHAAAHPPVIDFLKCNPVCPVYRIHQPNIPVEQVLCHNSSFYVYKDNKSLFLF